MASFLSSPSPRVGIIVLNYRGRDCLNGCLSSLDALDYPSKDVIVIDNASQDGSFEEAKRLFPHFFFHSQDTNGGFALGMNVGMRIALERGAEYLWLFNNDAVAEKNSLKLLVRVGETNPQVGLLSPLILGMDGQEAWFAAGRINFLRMRTEHTAARKEDLRKESYMSGYLTGCALLFKRRVIEKVGFLDEFFFLYYEDADYSLRAQRAGFETRVVPAALVRHSEQSNQSNQKLYHLVYSGLFFFGKYAPPALRPYLALHVTIRRIKNALDRLRGKERAPSVFQAYQDYFHEYTAFFYPRLR